MYMFCFADQDWRRHHRHTPANRLHCHSWKHRVPGSKDWPLSLQRCNLISPRHRILRREDHLQPTPFEVPHHQHQCTIMVADHLPRRGAENLQRRWGQCLRAHQGRQFSFGFLITLLHHLLFLYIYKISLSSIISSINCLECTQNVPVPACV